MSRCVISSWARLGPKRLARADGRPVLLNLTDGMKRNLAREPLHTKLYNSFIHPSLFLSDWIWTNCSFATNILYGYDKLNVAGPVTATWQINWKGNKVVWLGPKCEHTMHKLQECKKTFLPQQLATLSVMSMTLKYWSNKQDGKDAPYQKNQYFMTVPFALERGLLT